MRGETRFKKRIPCKLTRSKSTFSGLVLDLSRRGLFVQTTAVATAGDEVEVALSGREPGAAIVVTAKVVWQRKVPLHFRSVMLAGLGLQIQNAPETFFQLLSEASQGYGTTGARAGALLARTLRSKLAVQPRLTHELRKIGSAGLPVRTEALGMTYGQEEPRVHALRSLDLAIPGGQFLVVRGRSGSGKSTLFHLLAGMKKPTSGRVVVGDVEVNRLTEAESARFRRHKVGLVYQFFNLVPMLDVVENIALPLLLDGRRLTDSLPRVHALMERLGIADRADHEVSKLSGGEMQRVAIARALAGDPGLVLADEPTGNLDDRNASEVLDLLTGLCRENGITIVMMTHDAAATERADRVVTLRDGEIEQDLVLKLGPGT